jgi:hypothetical protein
MEGYNLYWYAFGMANGMAWGALMICIILYFIGKKKN